MDPTPIEQTLRTPAVLHVPYTFFPDACGGTEVYVRGLAGCLASRSYLSAVAAPGIEPSEDENDGLAVYRFASDQKRRLELAYGLPDEIAAQGWLLVLQGASKLLENLKYVKVEAPDLESYAGCAKIDEL